MGLDVTTQEIMEAVNEYNSICSKNLLKHRLKYYETSQKLVLGNREQLSYGSYQCELIKGADAALQIVKSLNKIINFESIMK